MTALAKFPIFALITLSFALSVSATDYRPDTNYPDLGFTSNDVVYDVFVHPDGRYLVAGRLVSGNTSFPFLKRYHADGTLDSSFNSALTSTGSPTQNHVRHILKAYPNGQYLVRGSFNVGGFGGNWARLNSNGTLDSTMPLSAITMNVQEGQEDGKLLLCGSRTENGTTYNTGYRLNANTTFDPTFRITFSDPVNCLQIKETLDGRILVTGEFRSGGQPIKRLHRLNSDGSLDQTFNAAIAPGYPVTILSVLPDGKVLISNGEVLRLLAQDGSQTMSSPQCSWSSFAIPLADGSFMVSGCRKYVGRIFPILRVKADGTVDQSMDHIAISGFEGLKGFRADGNGGFYLYGDISRVNNFSRRSFVRVVPDNTPPKARFDFDGDGKSDLAVFRPSDGVWYLYQSTAGFRYAQWGFSTDRVAASDADRDGTTDIGVFRDGAWHTLTSTGLHLYMCLGASGDRPMVGVSNDYGIYGEFFASRGSRSGGMRWFIHDWYTNCWTYNQQPIPEVVTGETSTDIPVVGDFNGDSLDEIGYFRDGYWYGVDKELVAAPTTFLWGSAGDIPIPGDYDGDRQTDYAIYRPSTGTWWINRSTLGPIAIRFGIATDIPVPADYDGDGKVDIAIYRDGQWWQYLSGDGSVRVNNWGLAGDIPIPAQNQ